MSVRRLESSTLALVAATLLMVGIYGTTPAGAASTSWQVTDSDLPAPSPDELVDLQRMADEDGTGIDQAINSFSWQNDFALLATSLEEDYPGDFAGAAIEDASRRVASISFKGEVPADATARIANLRGVTVIVNGKRGHSVGDLHDRMETVHRAIARRDDLVIEVVSTYDLDTGAIRVEVKPVVGKAAVSPDALEDSLRKELPAQAGDWPITIIVNSSLALGLEANYGGGRFEFLNSGKLACTAGFNVMHTGGAAGLSTAGHCSNELTFENYTGGAELATTAINQHRGSWGDFQWHSASGTEVDDFYYDFGAIRDVSGVANPSLNQRICRFGQASGASCAYVDDLDGCSTFGGFTHCRLVMMDRDTASDGDSGGPWYYGNTAYGIHTGYVNTVFGSRDVWSRVTYMDEALGLTVLR